MRIYEVTFEYNEGVDDGEWTGNFVHQNVAIPGGASEAIDVATALVLREYHDGAFRATDVKLLAEAP